MDQPVDLKSKFLLRPDITFLNFGSFGACPKDIFEDYQRWQLELEREPVQFFAVKGVEYIRQAREALAAYVHCDANDLVFTPNPTYAINILAKNLKFLPGDEILSTDLEYGALDRTWNYYCKKTGTKYIRQSIKLPVTSTENLVDQFWKGYTHRTKAIFISHITSSTGLIFPVKELCQEAKKRGLITIVDGAHVPGHVPLDINSIDADFYTGACHKWMMTPRGCSFLYARKELQNQLDPLVVSWGYESMNPSPSRFLDYHQFNGTRDFSAYLTVPVAIQFMQENNWEKVSEKCRKLTKENCKRFADLLMTKPLAPVTDEFYGQLCSTPFHTNNSEKLKALLYEKYKIEIPIMYHEKCHFIRYSIQAFNSQEDLDKLHEALKDIIETTDLIIPLAT